jgi:hypothetical protein
LEELLPKDNETIHLPLDGPVLPSESDGFSPEQMIRCDECLRANPPTRVNCLYCSATLPLTESSAKLRKPCLRQPDKHEPGFNCILVPHTEAQVSDESLEGAARFLKLSKENLQDIVDATVSLPLARTGSREEAELVVERLNDLGFETFCLSDEELGLNQEHLLRPRSFQIEEEGILLTYSGGTNVVRIAWSDLCLIVSGHLVVKKIEVQERMSRGSENELIDASQFFSDEPVFDLYSFSEPRTWRVGAHSFDFSCLHEQKGLVAGDNLKTLRKLVVSKCDRLKADDSFNSLRTTLEFVWPSEQETQSTGWRRERPGKFSLGAITLNSTEAQFTRYSRLRRYLLLKD